MAKDKKLPVRMTDEEWDIIKENATNNGFRSVSEYLRFLGMNAEIKIEVNNV